MTKLSSLLTTLLFLAASSYSFAQTPTDLSGIAFIVDPGHSLNENIGAYGYSEANKVLDVAFHLREFLRLSNADTVQLTRADRATSVSITQRYTLANNFSHPNKWFHSIHSDAAGPTANSILILISDKCAVSSGKICESRWGGVTISMGEYQSDIMSRTYRIPTRGVYGDRTFGMQFGTSYGSSGVGVLRETTMPATLSEGGFHTHLAQNLLNLNNESKRSEAKAIWFSMLAHFGVPRPPVGTLMGVITDSETNARQNGVTVSTGTTMYKTNTYDDTFKPYAGGDTTLSNGFYYFENLPPGQQSVTFSLPGYADSTIQISLVDTFFTFLDVKLNSLIPPRLMSSFPIKNQVGVLPNATMSLNFSRIVQRAQAEANIYLLDPASSRVPGSFTWSNSDRSVSFKPAATLLMDTTYLFVIGVGVRDLFGRLFDGNGDGVGGDSLVISFRTRTADVTPPAIAASYPANNALGVPSNQVINVTFDELLDPVKVTTSNVAVLEVGASLRPITLRYSEANGKGAINIYLNDGLVPGKSYKVRLSGLADREGNAIPGSAPLFIDFSVAPITFSFRPIDSFNSTVSGWWQPAQSGSTTGVDSAFFARDTIVSVPAVPGNTASARLRTYWRSGASDWLVRQYLGSGAPYAIQWQKSTTRLQVYLFGDGSNIRFRFAIDDNVGLYSPARSQDHEVSLWTTIDWVGWRLVEWDLENDFVGSWLGNGIIEGTLRFDSFQLRYDPGSSAISADLYFDELQLATGTVVSVQRASDAIPEKYVLHQNYPNPFNPETVIAYEIPRDGIVAVTVFDLLGRHIRTLVEGPRSAGRYKVTWDGRDDNGRAVPSGMYLIVLRTNSGTLSRKMTLVK